MTRLEYDELIKEAEKVFLVKKRDLTKEYVLSNNTVKIDDKITDHVGSIIVDKITVYISSEPQCMYSGFVINKDGSKSKLNKRIDVFQRNLK